MGDELRNSEDKKETENKSCGASNGNHAAPFVEPTEQQLDEKMPPPTAATESEPIKDTIDLNEIRKETLLWGLKREVKQIMEEAVTRRFIHEESSCVTALGASVEACLAHGLKRRVLGLFGTTSTFALLHKISKLCPPASSVLRTVIQTQQTELKERRSTAGSFEKFRSGSLNQKDLPVSCRYLWIRVAIFEKLLPTIVDFIVKEASKYYDKEALMMDTVRASMVASLLVGPCALEYTKMKTSDNYWSDPPADELIQRQKLHNRPPTSPGPRSPRPPLQMRRSGSIGPEEYSPKPSCCVGARDYVWSLHQNHKTTLLYGKNNVSVCPPDRKVPLRGYLSLHQNSNGTLSIKWTPNELMHSDSDPKHKGSQSTDKKSFLRFRSTMEQVRGFDRQLSRWASGPRERSAEVGGRVIARPQTSSPPAKLAIKRLSLPEEETKPRNDLNVFWQYAINLNIDEIVYLHFHQQGETGGSIVLVGADGVQHPPITFPLGQHPLAFLSCLENGLLPWGQLDPPLWLQKGKGKVFPKLHRRSSSTALGNGKVAADRGTTFREGKPKSNEIEGESAGNEEEAAEEERDFSQDFVFRIVPMCMPGRLSEELNIGSSHGSSASQSSSSKLVALSSFSSRLKERFLSISSSPASSPPTTPKTTSSGDTDGDGELEHSRETEHHPIEKRHSEPVMTATTLTDVTGDKGVSERDGTEQDSPSRTCIRSACDTMRYQILSRAFYGCTLLLTLFLCCAFKRVPKGRCARTDVPGLAHCRHIQTIRTHLSCLVYKKPVAEPFSGVNGLTPFLWDQFRQNPTAQSEMEFYRVVYFGGVDPRLRRTVWPYLLSFVSWTEEIAEKLESCRISYEGMIIEWMAVEAIVRQKDKDMFEAARECHDGVTSDDVHESVSRKESEVSEVFDESNGVPALATEDEDTDTPRAAGTSPEPSVAVLNAEDERRMMGAESSGRSTPEEGEMYSKELIDTFALNLHRIEKDVHRCDRNYPYFTDGNLEKLKNVMCTYVWEHLDSGYVQGMCDLAAPLLVIFDEEVLAYGCFSKLMERMGSNFPHGGGMDVHLANMRSLIQVMDPELFDFMHRNGDYTHFYFCYRWFLLDFKRELVYDDVFLVWEVIWTAAKVSSGHFVLFLALGLLMLYREIILDNNMDFTDVIKFFNEMAEKHDARSALEVARSQVRRLQNLIETNTK